MVQKHEIDLYRALYQGEALPGTALHRSGGRAGVAPPARRAPPAEQKGWLATAHLRAQLDDRVAASADFASAVAQADDNAPIEDEDFPWVPKPAEADIEAKPLGPGARLSAERGAARRAEEQAAAAAAESGTAGSQVEATPTRICSRCAAPLEPGTGMCGSPTAPARCVAKA